MSNEKLKSKRLARDVLTRTVRSEKSRKFSLLEQNVEQLPTQSDESVNDMRTSNSAMRQSNRSLGSENDSDGEVEQHVEEVQREEKIDTIDKLNVAKIDEPSREDGRIAGHDLVNGLLERDMAEKFLCEVLPKLITDMPDSKFKSIYTTRNNLKKSKSLRECGAGGDGSWAVKRAKSIKQRSGKAKCMTDEDECDPDVYAGGWEDDDYAGGDGNIKKSENKIRRSSVKRKTKRVRAIRKSSPSDGDNNRGKSPASDLLMPAKPKASNANYFDVVRHMLSNYLPSFPLQLSNCDGSVMPVAIGWLVVSFFTPRIFVENGLYPLFQLLFLNVYPAYASYKYLKMSSKVKENELNWLIYWVVYTAYVYIENITDFAFRWIPFYYEMKMMSSIWLISSPVRGCQVIYNYMLRPAIKRHEKAIDKYLLQLQRSTAAKIVKVVSETITYVTKLSVGIVQKTLGSSNPFGLMLMLMLQPSAVQAPTTQSDPEDSSEKDDESKTEQSSLDEENYDDDDDDDDNDYRDCTGYTDSFGDPSSGNGGFFI